MEHQARLLQQRLRLYRVIAAEPYAESVRKISAARIWQDPCQLLLLLRHVSEGLPTAPGCSCERCYVLYEHERAANEKKRAGGAAAHEQTDLARLRKALVHELSYSPLLATPLRTEDSQPQSTVFSERTPRGLEPSDDAPASAGAALTSGVEDVMSTNLSRTNSLSSGSGTELDGRLGEPSPGTEPTWAMQLMELQQVWEIATTPVPLHEAFAASIPTLTNHDRAGSDDDDDDDDDELPTPDS
ncbi:hypothetical protein F1559_003986 [Cyanidiococcus yangmingshanensis]|uniref:Uncharacterized protein n=1 Tax=Cyanidiococcus yangmingshanensis TaxID=2690220 RepID=A0A7J7IF10_9RHOD|nr:hypothetical protein F1559_003986 [Cyanidiococcus yangmingshanensis]